MQTTYPHQGQSLNISVECDDYIDGKALSAEGQSYIEGLLTRLDVAKKFAAKHLLETYNEAWADGEDHPEMDAPTFSAKLTLTGISIQEDPGTGSMLFDDADMFGGHTVVIDFDKLEPDDANLVG